MVFSKTGSTYLLSPVGNKVNVFDLTKYLTRSLIDLPSSNTSFTLPFETQHNICCLALTNDSKMLAMIDEGTFSSMFLNSAEGETILVNVQKRTLIGHHHFRSYITAASFSPDGSILAVGSRDPKKRVQFLNTHSQLLEFDSIPVFCWLSNFFDDVTTLEWTQDSR